MSKNSRALLIQLASFVAFIAVIVWLGRSPVVTNAILHAQQKLGTMGLWGFALYPLLFAACNLLLLPGGILADACRQCHQRGVVVRCQPQTGAKLGCEKNRRQSETYSARQSDRARRLEDDFLELASSAVSDEFADVFLRRDANRFLALHALGDACACSRTVFIRVFRHA